MFETSATSLRASLGSDHVARLVARASGAKSDSILAGVNPATYSTADPIRLFIIQAAIIIVMTRLIAIPLAKIRQPIVIAEVITGILLGPSVMGHIPKFSSTIFPTASLVNLNLMANVGLVLFMFTVGLEVDLAIISKNLRAAAYVGLAGISLPFALGAAISVGIFNDLIKTSPALQGNDVTFGHFLLFSGVAMAITAFPVLARILTETKLLATKVGTVVLAAGVANDVVGWVLLALTVALVNASSGLTALYVLLTTIAYALFLFLGVRPVFVWLAKRTGSLENGPTQTMTTITILLVLISAWFTDIVGVHAIFGAFIVGLMVPHEGGFAVALIEKIEDLVSVLLLPLYFALSGLKTNLGALNSGTIWGYTVGIIAIAFISKFAGCAGAARWACRFSLRESVAVGTLMSCKGLVELIVLNIGLNAGILDTSTFSMFVVMAIVSTVATTPLTLWAYPPHLRETADSHLIHSGKGAASEGQDPSAGFGSEGGEKDGLATSGKPIYQRLLVVLDRFENLPGLMTVIQLVQPFTSVRRGLVSEDSDDSDSIDAGTGAHSESDGDHQEGAQAQADSDEKKANSIVVATPILRSDAPHVLAGRVAPAGPTVRVSALRLIELTDRLSAVMKAADALVLESQRALDPLLAVFRTFASLHGLRVEGEELAIVERDEYARTVQNRDDRERKDRTLSNSGSHKEKGLVLVPWTLPHAYHSFAYPSTSLIGSPVGVVTPSVVPRSNPFESIFGRSSTSAADATDYSSSSSSDIGGGPQQASFVRRLFQGAHTSDIGLVLDRPASAAAATALLLPGANSAPKRVLLAFMGGPDDRAALSLVLSLCDVNENLRVTVLRLKRAADDDEEAAAEAGTTGQSLPPTVHHATGARSGASGIPAFTAPNQGGTVQDTIYPAQAGSSGMQASLEDDVAIESAKKHPACAQRGQVRFVHRAAAFPLSELLTVSEAAQGDAGGENDNAEWLGQAFSLIIVGRGRRMPTMTHRAELKALLASAASNARSTSTGGSSAEILSRIPNSQPATRAAALVRARAVPSSAGNHGLHAGALDSDTCKVIGEPAMALMLARISAPTLVIAASATTANSSLRA
ncbi:K(+)/H(+) antiporter [Tilletia horrida]|uniref:K(+)/H(+) antiporter n=1 Tax=Tilletia horrida TaxID=155126 RepID=A0AAN6GMG0_9BASI|nr:K(+)/H(+) antiporter [Tilletia horrida]